MANDPDGSDEDDRQPTEAKQITCRRWLQDGDMGFLTRKTTEEDPSESRFQR